jgi:hypothetical protein
MLAQHSLNLAEFYAEAREFHLLVRSTNEFNFTAGVETRQGRLSCRDARRRPAERVGNERSAVNRGWFK